MAHILVDVDETQMEWTVDLLNRLEIKNNVLQLSNVRTPQSKKEFKFTGNINTISDGCKVGFL